MKLLASIKSSDMYDLISSKVDGIVLGCEYSFYANGYFSYEDIMTLYKKCLDDNKELFLLVNIVMHNEYVDEIKRFINGFKDTNIKFIYQDLGILNILEDLNIANRGIYNPITMVTNYNDLLMYDSLGVDAVGLSSEITIKDAEICTMKSNKVFYLAFGYHPMYQTYRKLASLYSDYSGLNFSKEKMTIKELNKDAIDPMIENRFGCLVFRSGVISTLEKIDCVKNAKYLLVDGIFLDEETQVAVIDTYSMSIKDNISIEEGLCRINDLNLKINNRFMNVDSVYNPEDF